MRNRRRRALRAAVLGVFGVLVVAPGAHAATCVRSGAGGGTAVLTFAAADNTVTLSRNDAGTILYAVGSGAAAGLWRSHAREHRAADRDRQRVCGNARARPHRRHVRRRQTT